MAKMYVDGIDAIQNALHATEDGIADFVDDLLVDGGKIAKKNRGKHNAAPSRQNGRNDAVKVYQNHKRQRQGRAKIQRGQSYWKRERNSKGTANSYIAYVLNYGRSNYRGTHFGRKRKNKPAKNMKN